MVALPMDSCEGREDGGRRSPGFYSLGTLADSPSPAGPDPSILPFRSLGTTESSKFALSHWCSQNRSQWCSLWLYCYNPYIPYGVVVVPSSVLIAIQGRWWVSV